MKGRKKMSAGLTVCLCDKKIELRIKKKEKRYSALIDRCGCG